MASDDVLRHISIGQYIPGDSLVHRLDPRAKLIALGVLLVAVVAATGYVNNVVLLAFLLGVTLAARLPLGYTLGAVRPALPIILVLALFQLVFYTGGADARTLLALGPVRITDEGLRLVIVSLLRFLDLLLLTSLLTNTTTTGALTHGLERLLAPLNALRLPGHELAMVGAIALRFVPILGEQAEAILKAQASRGVAQGGGSRWAMAANARRIAGVIIPLFVDAYRRSDELALAMQARCYTGGRGRTHLVELRLRPADYLVLALAVALTALVLVLQRLP
ncbi:MAG: energy-coupling factor transporter transmembrane component T [Chloroflexota bacterium]